QRRACRVIPDRFTYTRQADGFEVSFTLPKGSYATMVLAEIFYALPGS
ncbi:MAG: tRNA pseudouridine(13) synthase TruD, partial [Gammaproteobacteria bacterium]|nr:tRNA pseudouridine(13) synthase TruD [Gammaproteobacteria bacterium]